MVDYAPRPPTITGCWETWSEQDQPQIIRTQMETGRPKVRRRTTGVHRIAQVSRIVAAVDEVAFLDWFRVDCQAGTRPTVMTEPNGKETVWRFIEPFNIDWIGPGGFRASTRIERLPGWQEV